MQVCCSLVFIGRGFWAYFWFSVLITKRDVRSFRLHLSADFHSLQPQDFLLLMFSLKKQNQWFQQTQNFKFRRPNKFKPTTMFPWAFCLSLVSGRSRLLIEAQLRVRVQVHMVSTQLQLLCQPPQKHMCTPALAWGEQQMTCGTKLEKDFPKK